jgi:hypothetical protein
MTRIIRVFGVLAIATVVPLGLAAQNRWGTKGDKGRVQETKTQTTSHPEHRRWRWDHHNRDAAGRPPGWGHGRKVGWHGRNLPPGQAKHDDERWYWHHHHKHHHHKWHHHHHHDWDHDRD